MSNQPHATKLLKFSDRSTTTIELNCLQIFSYLYSMKNILLYTFSTLLLFASCKKVNGPTEEENQVVTPSIEVLKSHNWRLVNQFQVDYAGTQKDTTDYSQYINPCMVYSVGEPSNFFNDGYYWMETDMCSSSNPNPQQNSVFQIDTSQSPILVAWGWYTIYYELVKLDNSDFILKYTSPYSSGAIDSSSSFTHYEAI